MSEMVERVVEAFLDAMRQSAPCDVRVIANATIKAMREPTADMVRAAKDLDDEGSSIYHEPYVAAEHDVAWRAMIDAALG
jgi:hypothetical protein